MATYYLVSTIDTVAFGKHLPGEAVDSQSALFAQLTSAGALLWAGTDPYVAAAAKLAAADRAKGLNEVELERRMRSGVDDSLRQLGGSGLSGIGVSVARVADLSALPDVLFSDGAEVGVLSLDDRYKLVRSNALTLDGFLVVATLSGVGAFVRKCEPSLRWRKQGAFFFSASGNDEFDGTTGVAVPGTLQGPTRTHKEWKRRVGGGGPLVDVAMTWAGAPAVDDTIDAGVPTNGNAVTISAPTVPVTTGTIGTWANRDVGAAGTPNTITAALANGQPWSTYVGGGFFVKMTSGAAVGLMAPVLSSSAASVAAVETFCSLVAGVATEVQPANGDQFQVVSLSTFPSVLLDMQARVLFKTIRFGKVGANYSGRDYPLDQGVNDGFLYCSFDGLIVEGSSPLVFTGCQVLNASAGGTRVSNFGATKSTVLNACALYDPANADYLVTGRLLLRRGAALQGTNLRALGSQGSTVKVLIVLQDAAAFATGGGAGGAVQALEGAEILAQVFWGDTGSAIPAVKLDGSGKLFLIGTGQTANTARPASQVLMPNAGAVTWALARAGIKEAASDASCTTVL